MARPASGTVNDTARQSNSLPPDLREPPTAASQSDAEEDFKSLHSEGTHEDIGQDARHRMISEAAYRLYAQPGYADGFELDDWLQAEAEVDRMLREQGTAPMR